MDYLKVFILSATPIFEIRGGLPLGIGLGLARWEAFAISVLGNISVIIPLRFILWKLEEFLLESKLTSGLYGKMARKARSKKASFEKYGKYALFLFVAIPLPTTGAYTACVAAHIFKISLRDSFFIISAGVVCSGAIILTAKILAVTGVGHFW